MKIVSLPHVYKCFFQRSFYAFFLPAMVLAGLLSLAAPARAQTYPNIVVNAGNGSQSCVPSPLVLIYYAMVNGRPAYADSWDNYNLAFYNGQWEFLVDDGSDNFNALLTNPSQSPMPPDEGWVGTGFNPVCLNLTFGDNEPPACNLTVFDVTGGGIYCPGSPGVQVGLTGRQEGVEYHFFKNFEETGQFSTYDPDYEEIVDIPWSSNFDEFSFESISDLAGEYTIVAVNASDFSCTVTMNGSATISLSEDPAVMYYADNDDDGFGCQDSETKTAFGDCSLLSCIAVDGYVTNNDDCDDTNVNVNPEEEEVSTNNIDDDCDGEIDEVAYTLSAAPFDIPCDYSGFTLVVSTTPITTGLTISVLHNSEVYPCYAFGDVYFAYLPAVEAGIQTYGVSVSDDGTYTNVEVQVNQSTTYYYDGDGDGYGTLFCDFGDILTGPTNTSSNKTALDVASGVALEFNTEKGGLSCSFKSCTEPFDFSYVTNNLDCDDNNPAINPEATDASCDGVDQNCNETKDEGYVSVPCDGADADLCVEGTTSCPNGSVVCSDMTPANVEVCNNIDDDCDAAVDEGVLVTFYADTDGDGFYGTNAATTTACTAPTGFVAANKSGDCQPTNNSIFPTAIEVCNGVDDNCDNVSELNAACSTPTVTMAPVINGNNVTFNWLKGCFKSYRVQFRRTTPANSTWTLRLVNSPNVLSLFVPTMGAGTYTWGVKGQCYSSNQFSSAGMGSNFTIGSTNPGFSPVGVSNKIIAAYPNPANKNLVVQIDANEDKACFIRLCDQMGKTAYGQHHEVDGISSVNIPVNHLAEGIYFLQVIVGADVQTQKIVVSH